MKKLYPHIFLCNTHWTVSSTLRPPLFLCSFYLVCMTLTSCSHGTVSLETVSGSCYDPLTYGLLLSRRTGLWVTPSAQSSSSFFSTSGIVWGRENSLFPTHLEPGSPLILASLITMLSYSVNEHWNVPYIWTPLFHSPIDLLMVRPISVEFSVVCRLKKPSWYIYSMLWKLY